MLWYWRLGGIFLNGTQNQNTCKEKLWMLWYCRLDAIFPNETQYQNNCKENKVIKVKLV